MPLVRTAAAARSGRRRFARGLRFGWSRPGQRGLTTVAALLAYLVTVVSVPAWHDHEHAHHAATSAEESEATACGHCHAGHAHDHDGQGEADADRTTPEGEGLNPAPVDHNCRVCELLATPATPVAPPTVADVTAPLPERVASVVPDKRAVFIRTWNARGPPRG